jgi:hypothetical protein
MLATKTAARRVPMHAVNMQHSAPKDSTICVAWMQFLVCIATIAAATSMHACTTHAMHAQYVHQVALCVGQSFLLPMVSISNFSQHILA